MKYVRQFEQCGIDMIHFDVMDGNYVPNISLGTGCYKALREETKLPLDLHLMVQNPDKAIDYFDVHEGDFVSFHPQTISANYTLLKKIKSLGANAGIALNPGTSISYIEELKDLLDFVLVMTVEPGFPAQKLTDNAIDKVSRVTSLRKQSGSNFDIYCDGNCTVENSRKLKAAGANGIIVGSVLLNSDIKIDNFSKAFYDFKSKILS